MNLPVSRDKVVSVSYVLRNARGEVYEIRDLPVEYLHGSGADLFPRIEEALDGKSVGDLVSISLTPDEAFGERDPGLSFTDDLDHVPEELRRIGAEFEAKNSRGESRTFVVTHIADGKLTVDANHPLAGGEDDDLKREHGGAGHCSHAPDRAPTRATAIAAASGRRSRGGRRALPLRSPRGRRAR